MDRRVAVASLAAAVLLLPLLPATAARAETGLPPVLGLERQPRVSGDTDTIIVTFTRDQQDPEQAATDAVEAAAEAAETGIAEVSAITDAMVAVRLDATISAEEAAAIGAQAEEVSGVKAAEASATFTTATDDEYFDLLWNIKNAGDYGVNAPGAWETSTGEGVIVGVIDTGITAHPDLTGSSTATVGGNVIAGHDFISDSSISGDEDGRDPDPTDAGDYCETEAEDSSWHGTHVAGIIAAIKDNATGVVGVAPDAVIEPLRALGRCGGDEEDVIAAILWGAGISVDDLTDNPHPVSVLNMSLGGTGTCTTAMQSAIDQAVDHGVAVVVAAGNEGDPLRTSMPANCDNVIRVVASTYAGTRASYSNYGTSSYPATISAPGGAGQKDRAIDWIISTWNDGATTADTASYAGMVGTSMATPHVAGVAALLRSIDPDVSVTEVSCYLKETAIPMSSCTTRACGAGIVDADAAVDALTAADTVDDVTTPTISGIAVVGATVSTKGTGATGASYTYQWLRDGEEISGATSKTRTLKAADEGAEVSVRVTATNGCESASRTSDAVTVAASPTAGLDQPVVTGTPQVGQTLSTEGTGATDSTYTYQWLRNGKAISGATSASRTLKAADEGARMSVTVTATYGSASTSLTSAATTQVVPGTFSQLSSAYLSGTAKKGYTLKGNAGTWSPTPTTIKRQWLRNGSNISGATGFRYTLTKADRGKEISVRIRVFKDGYTTTTVYSPAVVVA